MLPRNIIAVIRWNWGSPALTRVLEASTWLLRSPPLSREFLFLDFRSIPEVRFFFYSIQRSCIHEVRTFENHDYTADFSCKSLQASKVGYSYVIYEESFLHPWHWKIWHCSLFVIDHWICHHTNFFQKSSGFVNLYFILFSVWSSEFVRENRVGNIGRLALCWNERRVSAFYLETRVSSSSLIDCHVQTGEGCHDRSDRHPQPITVNFHVHIYFSPLAKVNVYSFHLLSFTRWRLYRTNICREYYVRRVAAWKITIFTFNKCCHRWYSDRGNF